MPLQAEVSLTTDVDRDGIINPELDEANEERWTKERGALFLNNCDSDLDTGEPDNYDSLINGKEDLKDLARINVSGIDNAISLHVKVNEDAVDNVRIFADNGEGLPISLELGYGPNVAPSFAGGDTLTLWIEARNFAHAEWMGFADVTLMAEFADGTTSEDTVRLRVAPFLLLSNSAPGKKIYVRDFPGRNEKLIEQLTEIAPEADADLVVVPPEEENGYPAHNIWLQDTMEIGYTEMPGVRMNVVMKANRNKPLDNYAKEGMLGPDFGWIECGEFRREFGQGNGGKEWLDWYGNLDVTPPLPDHPRGRVFYGIDGEDSLNPEVVSMLEAQGVQAPAIPLDVGWLLIKHVDETVGIVPLPDGTFKVMVPDNTLMVKLLKEWDEAGYGDLEILDPFKDYGFLKRYEKVTVKALLDDEELMAYAEKLQEERIEPLIETIKTEFQISDAEIIRVPFLQSETKTTIFPNMINALFINGHLVMADPAGPIVDGVDQLQNYMRREFSDSGIEIHFVDDRQYHKWSGNVHCATNVAREGFEPNWWTEGN